MGSLWSSSGQLLASATFTSETDLRVAAGDLLQSLSRSYPNTTYVVSLLCAQRPLRGDRRLLLSPTRSDADWWRNTRQLPAARRSLPPTNAQRRLHTTVRPATFPTSTDDGNNYWVDVRLLAVAGPGQVTGRARATAGYASATRDLDRARTGGPATQYTSRRISAARRSRRRLSTVPRRQPGPRHRTHRTERPTRSRSPPATRSATGPASAASNAVTPTSASGSPSFVQQVSAHGRGPALSADAVVHGHRRRPLVVARRRLERRWRRGQRHRLGRQSIHRARSFRGSQTADRDERLDRSDHGRWRDEADYHRQADGLGRCRRWPRPNIPACRRSGRHGPGSKRARYRDHQRRRHRRLGRHGGDHAGNELALGVYVDSGFGTHSPPAPA